MTRPGPRRRAAAFILAVAVSFACDSVPPADPIAPPPGLEPDALWLAPFLSPASWARQRAPSNPVIHAGLDPEESLSAYNPAPIRLANGDLLVYVKEDERRVITAYRSTDDGATFTLEGIALAPGEPGAWDAAKVLDPVAVYDRETGVIHLWYKGTDPHGQWNDWRGRLQIGYATATDDAPTRFTRHPANPILTPRQVEEALGLQPASVEDLVVSDVIRIGETWYFYGSYSLGDNDYRIFYGIGPYPSYIIPKQTIVTAGGGYGLAYEAAVFQHPSSPLYLMVYSEGAVINGGSLVHLRAAWSEDGANWTKIPEWVLLPDDSEIRVYAAAMLKENVAPFTALDFAHGHASLFYSLSPWAPTAGHDITGLLRMWPWGSRLNSHAAPRLVVTRPPNPNTGEHQHIPTDAWTDVGWTAKPVAVPNDMIHWGMHPWNPVAEITIREEGWYAVFAAGEFAHDGAGERRMRLLWNDSVVASARRRPGSGSKGPLRLEVGAELRLQGGDRLRLQVMQSSGRPLDLFAGTLYPFLTLTFFER